MATSKIKMESAAVEDFKDARVPEALYWTTEQVADWIEEIGFPDYRICIVSNYIDGRRLIHLEASRLPKIGICDFDHITLISKSIRDLLSVEEPDCNKSITRSPRSDLGMYLERKSFRGADGDDLTYKRFLQKKDKKWKPPLTNVGLVFPQD